MARRGKRIGIVASVTLLGTLAFVAARAERTTGSYAQAVAQGAAEAAALAGAASFRDAPLDADLAKAQATEYVRINDEAAPGIALSPADIEVDTEQGTIRVRVEGRALGLPALIAGILGISESVVTGTASAEYQAVRCVDVEVTSMGTLQECTGITKSLKLIEDPLPTS